VGEVNVVEKMKAVGAVIGGEGNGGVILPDLHYGRDALAGVALILGHLAEQGVTLSELKKRYPAYAMIKDKVELTPDLDVDGLLEGLKARFSAEECNTEDGLKVDFKEGWVHLRKSNTEPIVRIYSEADTEAAAQALVDRIKTEMNAIALKS
ncbi:MAG TPA: phosphoglucosamine mutase, partial [Flavilitoribacter sp.]|nr:phosphoglucosamine mutase [Flavilitoribacter sp.]